MRSKTRKIDELDTFARDLRAARDLAPLSRGDERELARRARDGDAAARNELARRHLPLVVAFARKQAHGGVRLDELVQEGNLGILRAMEKYDPDAGTRFSTYAVWWIRAYVWRYLKSARSTVRPKSGTVALTDLSLDSPLGDEEEATFLDRLEDEGASAHARFAAAETAVELGGALEKARGRIGELGWDIIHSRLKQDPPDTLEEIGRRWGLSRERVRQVEASTKRFLHGWLRPVEDARRAA